MCAEVPRSLRPEGRSQLRKDLPTVTVGSRATAARTSPPSFGHLGAVVDEDGYPESYLHIKDVLYADTEESFDAPVQSKRFRPLFTVTADDEVEEALAQMQKAGIHVARVIDSQAQVLGLLFLEDVLEELVGEVQDAMQRGRFDFRR